jgi:O-antigen ligase
MKDTNRYNIFFSTLNFVLMFIGYQLATSLFLPVSSDIEGISRTVTVPYRAFALLVSLIVILLNYRNKIGQFHLAIKVLLFFWIALIIRIFYDTNVRFDIYLKDTSQLWFYVFGIVLPAMYSVIKSYRAIDLNKALKWVYLGTVITLILSLFNNSALLMEASEITGRAEGNLALNTISFGHLGTMGFILSLFLLSRQRVSVIKRIFIIFVMLLSFFIMLRAGSRSPVLALAVVLIFWLFARGKNLVLGISITAVTILLIFVFMDPILSFMGNISPVIEARLRASIYEGESSGRDPLYNFAFQAFLEKPLVGSQFAIFNKFGGFSYSHNIILDALMGLGLFGGLAMLYILWSGLKSTFVMIKLNDNHFWISLILIQQIVLSMLSGSIYYNQRLNVLLVFVVLYTTNYSIKKKRLHYV